MSQLPDYIHRCNKFTQEYAEVDKNYNYNITTASEGSEAFYAYQSTRRKERYELAKMEYEFKIAKERKDIESRKLLREGFVEELSKKRSEKRKKTETFPLNLLCLTKNEKYIFRINSIQK